MGKPPTIWGDFGLGGLITVSCGTRESPHTTHQPYSVRPFRLEKSPAQPEAAHLPNDVIAHRMMRIEFLLGTTIYPWHG